MAKYAQLTDASDAVIKVLDRHLLKADVYVDAKLNEKGIAPASITLPQPLLTEIAVNWALGLSAAEQATGENSPVQGKAKQYEHLAETLMATVSRASLGLTEITGAGYGFVNLGRG